MKNKTFNIGLVIIAAAILLAGVFLFAGAPVEAAPALAPTPVANLINSDDGAFFNFQPATAITADGQTSQREVLEYDFLDVQYVINHGTVNTTTLTVQYSNDGSNWVNGVALVSASVADGSSITRVPVFGRYMRVDENVATSSPITITVNAVGR